MEVNKDGKSYREPDSGCEQATKFLKEQSSCFNCPFVICYEEMSINDRRKLRKGDKKLIK